MTPSEQDRSFELPSESGTYVLVLEILEPLDLEVGALGAVHLDLGWALYVGSALGPGGIRSRIDRHLGSPSTRHWHVDYLSAAAPVEEVWYVVSDRHLECRWFQKLRDELDEAEPVSQFGASDCSCDSHLLWSPDLPVPRSPKRHVQEDAKGNRRGEKTRRIIGLQG